MDASISPERQGALISYIRETFNMADTVTAARSEMWRRVEERYRAFINVAETHRLSGNVQYPFDESIVIPYSYALVQAIVAYWFTLFTAQSPLKQVQDIQGDNVRGADLMELLIAHYDRLNDANNLLYGALLDACKYGFGGGKTLWDERWETRPQRVMRPVSLLGMNLGMAEETRKRTVKTFDGPLTTLFDPWLMAFDPRVPMSDFQRGNFVGETLFTSWYNLKEHEKPYGPYEDVDKIPRWGYKDAIAVARQTSRLQVLGLPNYFDAWTTERDRGFVLLEQLWAKLVPSDLDLGPGDRPELWLLTLANRSQLIQAEPAELPHNKFPYFAIESSPDMHSMMNPGTMELLMPLQDFMDWLANCHDAMTEILTERGWVPFPELGETDRVATVHPDTRQVWFERPKRLVSVPYSGDMIHIESDCVDVLVTPNHRMWVSKLTGGHYAPYRFVRADEIRGVTRLPGWVTWDSGPCVGAAGLEPPQMSFGNFTIPQDVLASFLGYFVSEGNVHHNKLNNGHIASIAQKKSASADRIDAVMAKLPWKVSKSGHLWRVNNKQLFEWLSEQCGTHSSTRTVPRVAATWTNRQVELFLRAAIDGDGHWVSNTYAQYSSTSKELVDGLQILAMRLGWRTSVTERRGPTVRKGRGPEYKLNISTTSKDRVIATENVHRISFSDKVYCVENSTHLIITRRNGRVLVAGQSHFENIRKALNDMFVVDAEKIYLSDLLSPAPMKVIRIRPEFYGTDVRQAVQQLQVTDVTKSHLNDMQMVFDLMQRVSAALDALMGVPSSRRRTATEAGGTFQLAANRLKVTAQLISSMGLSKWGQQQASLIQAYMTAPQMVQIVGPRKSAEYRGAAEGTVIEVNPEDILGEWNFPVHDGSMPLDPVRMADTWEKVLVAAAKIPEIAAQYDLGKIYERGLRSLGIRDVTELKKMPQGAPLPIRPRVMPDEEVMRGVDRGDLVPLGNGQGAGGGAGAGPGGVPAPS